VNSKICKGIITSISAHSSFFYNSLTGNCERFLYGGCGGNRNRFETLARCWERCGHLSQQRQRSG
jgi:hypothetical protein